MIEIGEYIRTKKGEIMKVTSIPVEVDGKVTYQTDKGWVELECDIIKHSKNIVDLIEAGDFVNGERVIETLVTTNRDGSKLPLVRFPTDVIRNEEIKEIITHEQYEQNCYRLEE